MFNNAPNTIVHKGKKAVRDAIGVAGLLCALAAFGHYNNGNASGMLIAAGMAAGFFYGASKIKTTMKATRQRTFYR
ncbi:hypothetical protein KBY27_05335 [Ruegeria pomeroyi]|uniref:Uncharacterized protein n=1 Tax=Ruegeria pomeroyi TaxID=89184 RepID=A0A9Q3WIB7_9RHOB|nr:hypothetical protein [Ruegeria pomeroyi]MCE8536870.1 hypothetical protein [Ruegeria pomeroyi]